MLAIKLNAGHDRNGNPRRVFILFDNNGQVVKTFDESYRGTPLELKDTPYGGEFQTTPKEYRKLINR